MPNPREFRFVVKSERDDMCREFIKALVDDDLSPGEWFWENVQRYLSPKAAGDGLDVPGFLKRVKAEVSGYGVAAFDGQTGELVSVRDIHLPTTEHDPYAPPKQPMVTPSRKPKAESAAITESHFDESAEMEDSQDRETSDFSPAVINYGIQWSRCLNAALNDNASMSEELLGATSQQAATKAKVRLTPAFQKEAYAWLRENWEGDPLP